MRKLTERIFPPLALGLSFLCLGTGVTVSLGGHHRMTAYVLWYGLGGLFICLFILAIWLSRSKGEPPPPSPPPTTPSAMFHVGHLGEGKFTRSSGRMLAANSADRLIGDENIGPGREEEAAQAAPPFCTDCLEEAE